MEKSYFKVHDVDDKGNKITITCEGVDDQQLAHFGGLDLHVKAVKTLIRNTNGTDFARKAGDFFIEDKVIALYLNEIGRLIRNFSDEREWLKDYSNMELVQNFLEHWQDNSEIVELVNADNQAIENASKEFKREEDEIWENMISELRSEKK
jgi:hypothetical protein